MSNAVNLTLGFDLKFAIYKYPVFAWAKTGEKERPDFLDSDLKTFDVDAPSLFQAKRNMSEWIERALKTYCSMHRTQFSVARK